MANGIFILPASFLFIHNDFSILLKASYLVPSMQLDCTELESLFCANAGFFCKHYSWNLCHQYMNFSCRNGLSADTSKMSFAEMMTDDAQTSREERCFRLWINSLGTATYVNNVFEDIRNGWDFRFLLNTKPHWTFIDVYDLHCRWVLLEVLDKVSPGSVNWKLASKPPIKMPFRKVENCNQVIQIGKDLCFSLVNVAGNDIVQGNKKLILGYLIQLNPLTSSFLIGYSWLGIGGGGWRSSLISLCVINLFVLK